jgi:hypothetical protein
MDLILRGRISGVSKDDPVSSGDADVLQDDLTASSR